jgi:hypothetical protein
MAVITLPHTFADGAAAAAANMRDNVYDAVNAQTSLAERNGLLDENNLAQNLGFRSFRLGSAALGGTVTMNSPWEMLRVPDTVSSGQMKAGPIPGMGARFFLPWQAHVWLAWTLTYRGNFDYSLAAKPPFRMRLWVDGVAQTGSVSHMAAWWGNDTLGGNSEPDLQRRSWTGTWMTPVAMGARQWHQGGLRLAVDVDDVFVRFYRGSFTWLALKI